MHLFGKAKKTQPKDAIIKLRETLSLLEKREAFLQNKADAELLSAKKNAAKNKRGSRFEFPCNLSSGSYGPEEEEAIRITD